ncbi:hypothetical protein CBR_g21065 [Chara braunii]|uniref:Complex III subunit 9 n=1 Tax=Chara braunii TaxID=69332 RepID=A0A388L0J3_CHABU|nr:hypothetical protein CBR_g21065 [Chara braunii]|eukprot:GBG75820.1 hypothetical protein CBR_g21065 [Chara braunii]
MERAAGPSLLNSAYRLFMRRTSVYVGVVITGALIGERLVDSGINKLWIMNNKGKQYEDIPVLGQRTGGSDDE